MKRSVGTVALAGALAGACALSGCAAFTDPDPAADGELRVAASFYPLAWAAEQVAGDDAEVTNLTQPGGEPHDLELGIRQAAALESADVVVYESGFQPAVDEGVADLAQGTLVDAFDLLPEPGHDEDDHDAEHDEHEEAPAEEDHEGHDHGAVDPHFWLDPLRMSELVGQVAEALAQASPEHADAFRARAAELAADLRELDGAYAAGLADCERDVVVVSHDAYGYLERYGLTFAPISATPDTEPTPADLARLQDIVRDEDVTTVFYEPLDGPDTADAVAADLDLVTAGLDPIEGLSDETAGEDYLTLMRANLTALQEADGCR